jgi:transposase
LATHNPANPKLEILRQHGCLNPKPHTVQDERFATEEFFDPCDLLQVKYEMVRCVRTENSPIIQVAQQFGFSRPTVYQALVAFDQGGLASLIPRRPGPRRAHKLNAEIVSFLKDALSDNPQLRPVDLAKILLTEFSLSVYPSSIDRALRRQEKKQR